MALLIMQNMSTAPGKGDNKRRVLACVRAHVCVCVVHVCACMRACVHTCACVCVVHVCVRCACVCACVRVCAQACAQQKLIPASFRRVGPCEQGAVPREGLLDREKSLCRGRSRMRSQLGLDLRGQGGGLTV